MKNVNLNDQSLALNATAPAATVTQAYKFASTADLVQGFEQRGWVISNYNQARVRNQNKVGKQKHVVRMRRADGGLKVGDSFVEIVIMNSHDGTSGVKLFAGLFRLVCSNGMVIGDTLIPSRTMKHIGRDFDKRLQEFVDELDQQLPEIERRIAALRDRNLTRDQQLSFARAALELRLGKSVTDDEAIAALAPRRADDNSSDAWTVFNRLQESVIRGGSAVTTQNGRNARLREIRSVDRNVSLNRQLFDMAVAIAA